MRCDRLLGVRVFLVGESVSFADSPRIGIAGLEELDINGETFLAEPRRPFFCRRPLPRGRCRSLLPSLKGDILDRHDEGADDAAPQRD
jgi:hypothetical protein